MVQLADHFSKGSVKVPSHRSAPGAPGKAAGGWRRLLPLLTWPHPLPVFGAQIKGSFHLGTCTVRGGSCRKQPKRKDAGLTLIGALVFLGMEKSLVGPSTETAQCEGGSFFFNFGKDEIPTRLSQHVMPWDTMAPEVCHPLLVTRDPVHLQLSL